MMKISLYYISSSSSNNADAETRHLRLAAASRFDLRLLMVVAAVIVMIIMMIDLRAAVFPPYQLSRSFVPAALSDQTPVPHSP